MLTSYATSLMIQLIGFSNGRYYDKRVTHLRTVIKLSLRCLSMMHVKINNKNSLNAQIFDCIFGGDSNVVAKAEAIKLRRHGMVTRWTNQSYAIGYLSCRWNDIILQSTIDDFLGPPKMFYIEKVVHI